MEIKKSGIITPKTVKGVRCGYCSKIIWADCEPNKRLSLLKGKPICIICRLKLGKRWKEMYSNTKSGKKYNEEKRESLIQAEANRVVEDIAIKQTDANNDLKK